MASISTLFDNFDDNSIDTSIWTADAGVVETGQQLQITLPPSPAGTDVGIVTSNVYTFTDTSVQIQMPQLASDQNCETDIYLDSNTNQLLIAIYNGGSMYLRIIGTNLSTDTTITYNAANHVYFRFRTLGSTKYIESSPTSNSGSWTTLLSLVDSFNSGGWTFGMQIYCSNRTRIAKTAIFDNLNASSSTQIASLTRTRADANVYSETATTTVTSFITRGGTAVTTSVPFQAIPQKDYEFRVFNKSGTYVSTWTNVSSDPSWSQSLGQTPSEMTVKIARSPDNRIATQDVLKDSAGANITDTSGNTILVSTDVVNAVGSGTDVDINLYVDVYVFYGGYESLLDTNSNVITDTTGDPITVQYGAPNGKRVYSGYIVDYELAYGNQKGVTVTIAPHAVDQSQIIFHTVGGDTTVPYLSADPVQMGRDALDRATSDGSLITYDATSMPLSGQVVSYEFNLQTTKATLDKVVDLLPENYYSFVDPGELKQYILPKSVTANHTFYYEQHITDLKLKRSISQLTNKVYVVGGEYDSVGHPGESLFKYYSDATSISTYRPGLEIISDSRVTLATTAQILAQAKLNELKDPRYRTTVVISDGVYDIETIKLGQMVAFKNFGSFVDTLLLQIVTINRSKHSVSLDLDMLVPSDSKRIEDIKRRIETEETSAVPVAPI